MTAVVGYREPWEKQYRESSKAFAAFAYYRDLGPGRSVQKVAEYLLETGQRRSDNVESIRRHVGDWSAKYHWIDRVEAYELQQDRDIRAEREQARRELEERHNNLAQSATFAALARARGLQRPAEQGGNVEALHPNQIADWNDFVRVAEFAIRTERLTNGLPTDISRALSHVPVMQAVTMIRDIIEAMLKFVPDESQEQAFTAAEDVLRRAL
jgi:hypothetical protein